MVLNNGETISMSHYLVKILMKWEINFVHMIEFRVHLNFLQCSHIYQGFYCATVVYT